MGRQRELLEDEAQVVAVLFSQLRDVLVAGRAVGTLKVRVLDESVPGVFFAAYAGLVVDRSLERILECVFVGLSRSLLGFLLYASLLLLCRLVQQIEDGLLVGLDRLNEDIGILLQSFLELIARDVTCLRDSTGQNRDRQSESTADSHCISPN